MPLSILVLEPVPGKSCSFFKGALRKLTAVTWDCSKQDFVGNVQYIKQLMRKVPEAKAMRTVTLKFTAQSLTGHKMGNLWDATKLQEAVVPKWYLI